MHIGSYLALSDVQHPSTPDPQVMSPSSIHRNH